MDISRQPLKTTVQDGDEYVDVIVHPHRSDKGVNIDELRQKLLARNVAAIFGAPKSPPMTLRTERIKLRWIKPVFDEDGKIIGKALR